MWTQKDKKTHSDFCLMVTIFFLVSLQLLGWVKYWILTQTFVWGWPYPRWCWEPNGNCLALETPGCHKWPEKLQFPSFKLNLNIMTWNLSIFSLCSRVSSTLQWPPLTRPGRLACLKQEHTFRVFWNILPNLSGIFVWMLSIFPDSSTNPGKKGGSHFFLSTIWCMLLNYASKLYTVKLCNNEIEIEFFIELILLLCYFEWIIVWWCFPQYFVCWNCNDPFWGS